MEASMNLSDTYGMVEYIINGENTSNLMQLLLNVPQTLFDIFMIVIGIQTWLMNVISYSMF